MLIPVDTLEEPGLADYRDVANPERLLARGLFVAEGRLVLERLVAQRAYRLRSVLLSTAAAQALHDVVARVPDEAPVYVTSLEVMREVVGFNMHRGCLAIAERPAVLELEPADLRWASRVLVLEGVNNPDNVGGLFRAGAALGADLVVLGSDCGDPLYRKAIRTSMAATLSLPWWLTARWPDALDDVRAAGLTVIACTPHIDAPSLYEVSPPARAAVLVGAEGPGLSADALARADLRVRIPMHGGMDSLNVATAAAIVLSALAARAR